MGDHCVKVFDSLEMADEEEEEGTNTTATEEGGSVSVVDGDTLGDACHAQGGALPYTPENAQELTELRGQMKNTNNCE